MFSLRDTLANRQASNQLPPGYDIGMGIVVLCGRRPVSITRLRDLPRPQSVIVHFKSLLPINNNINQFIRRQLSAMQRLFAEGGIAVLPGTTEDLSGNPALQPLQSLDVGQCGGTPTAEQTTLFTNRNNVSNNELVVYIVANLIDASGAAGNFLGCATHPSGQPGAAVVQSNARWLVAHEVGHVLGLAHVCEVPDPPPNPPPPVPCGAGHSDSLMFPNVGWTNEPPDLAAAEYTTMLNSGLSNP